MIFINTSRELFMERAYPSSLHLPQDQIIHSHSSTDLIPLIPNAVKITDTAALTGSIATSTFKCFHLVFLFEASTSP